MNVQIRRVGVVAALLVFALLANLTYFIVAEQTELEASPYNVRARQSEFDIHRGQILAGDVVIADSIDAPADSVFRYQRVYANGPLYAQVTGFYSYIYNSSRVENSFNTDLVGKASSQWLQNLIDTISGRTPAGASVVTTISPTLQQAAWDALQGYTGAIVALDPHTGAVKALVSSPSFDPNRLAAIDRNDEVAAWEELTTDPTRPMSDRGTREIYPPGSTFKLVVAATALEQGYTQDTMIDTPASLPYPNSNLSLTNASNCGNEQVTLARAVQLSCNTAFANLGLALGARTIQNQAAKFGFGAPHLYEELGGVASHFPIPVDDAALMRSAIGQDSVTASPLQMAMVASVFVNGGQLAEPYLVEEVRAPDLSVLWRHEVNPKLAVSPATAQAMQEMMVSVVTNGSGTGARIPGVTVGGKSGTAQSDPDNPNYAWFVSFALDPDIVVTVFLERGASSVDLWGGTDAAPLAKKVIEASR